MPDYDTVVTDGDTTWHATKTIEEVAAERDAWAARALARYEQSAARGVVNNGDDFDYTGADLRPQHPDRFRHRGEGR